MGVFDVLKFWKVRFAIAVTIVGVGASVIAVFLFTSHPLLARILLATEIGFIILLAWTFWSIITNPPDIEKIKQLLAK